MTQTPILSQTRRALRRPRFLDLVRFWLGRRETREHLAELDPRLLADVGLSEAERRRECSKWFWQ
jgi:uncharacterized protein YjiS (DUF1127 family)